MGESVRGVGIVGARGFVVRFTVLLLAAISLSAVAVSDAGAVKIGAGPVKVGAGLDARVGGSVGQIWVQDATPDSTLILLRPDRRVMRIGRTDSFGSEIFRDVKPGPGYRVVQRVAGKWAGSRLLRSRKPDANPPQSYYDNLPPLKEGLNYVRMRDGIELAMTVRLPVGRDISDGPFPTVMEYSGYGTAAPGDLLSSLLGGGDPQGLPTPDGATIVGSALAPLLGYASVSVQMRGSGCSGGAYGLFDLPTTYDGYDAIEAIAAQDWSGGRVGMVGISYSGISQLFAAGTRPPHLSAVAPMSVTTDIYRDTGYPGGIFNDGFALSWVKDRVSDAEPAPQGGQNWARRMITDFNDAQCLANQKLRLQTQNVLDLIDNNPFRTPRIFDDRSPGEWMKRIDVPVMLMGQFQDEQTGANFVNSLTKLNGNPNVWINMQNGVHNDAIGPGNATQWVEFIDIFMGDRVPEIPALFLSSAFSSLLGPSDPIKQSAYVDLPNVAAAEAAFKRDYSRVRLMMDSGAGPVTNGAQGPTWELAYRSWPPKNQKATTLYLGPGGTLGAKSKARSVDSYVSDPSARPRSYLVSGSVGDTQPNTNWAPVVDGKGLGYVTAPLARDVVIAGGSSINAWVRSSVADTDFQATLSEVRPDGQETYVQTGWLRASHRKLKPDGQNPLNIVPTHLESDAAPLPAGKFTEVTIPIFPVAHAFRAGSRIRLTILAPGGDRAVWELGTLSAGETNAVLIGGKRPASLTLPVLTGVEAPTALPDPTDLRGQPSRAYAPASNGG
jgi:predicted acyl esterase